MIDAETAARIAEILVVECGADAKLLDDWGFVRYLVTEDPNQFPIEFRFMGRLGFGGKFRVDRTYRHWYVDYYSEDKNATRTRMVRRANERLAELQSAVMPDVPT